MPKNLERYYGRQDLHFITFSCYRRLPFLRTSRNRDVLVAALGDLRERYGFLLVGYVVMPEHVHLLISETPARTPSSILMVLKHRVATDLKGARRNYPQFWQRRFYDFNVHSAQKIREKLNYMHANPIKRKLVKMPGDWLWSSFSAYEKGERGLVPIDFVPM
jgi:putative transposase